MFFVLTLGKTQWIVLVTGRYMITMMVLLCYGNLFGMSLECIVIILMNNSQLGGQFCTDSVNVLQGGANQIGRNRLLPCFNFTCNSSIIARLNDNCELIGYPVFQVWQPTLIGSTLYNKIGEV